MSSVKDRIRNLQQATNPLPSKSVPTRAQAVEQAANDRPPALAELTKQFDRPPVEQTTPSLGARVARFDSDSASNLKETVQRLEASTQDTRSLVGRAALFERSNEPVKKVAAALTQTSKTVTKDDSADNLQKTRAMFEAASKKTTLATPKVPSPKLIERKGEDDAENKTDVKLVPPIMKPSPKPGNSSPAKQAVVEENPVARKAAMFERSSTASTNSGRASSNQDLEKSLSPTTLSPSSKNSKSSDASPKQISIRGKSEKSLRDELMEVKRSNEELLSTLLQLTAAFKKLEATRESLQNKISELEKSNK